MPDTIPISAVTDAASYKPPIERTDELDKDAFLQLLVAQLKYQNPLSPSDPGEFMAQTAQFTMVEKITQLATDTAAQRAMSESMAATGLIGKEITWVDGEGDTQRGVVTGTTFGAEGATLLVGEEQVPLERITGANAPSATTAAEDAADAVDETATTDPAAAAAGTTPTDPTNDAGTDAGDPTAQTQEA